MSTLNLTGFHPEMRDLIGVALDLGWSAMQTGGHAAAGKATVILHSYDSTQSVRCTPVRQINAAKLATMRRKVIKYAEPMKRINAIARIGWADDHGGVSLERFVEALPKAGEAIAFGTVEVPDPEVTGTRPWLARKAASKGGGKVYESAAVIERTWNTGDVDYECAFAGCDFTHQQARSVASHYGQAHTAKGETEPKAQEPTYPAGDYFEPLTHRPYRPQERLIQALAAYLDGAIAEYDGSRAIAVAALEWMHERPDLPDVEPESRGPLTPEQILEEVRALVGAPLASRLVQAQEQAEALTASLAELEAQVLTRDALIERLRDERRTLADLLAEEQS